MKAAREVEKFDDHPVSKKRKFTEIQSNDESHMAMPIIESLLNRSFPFEAKIGCLITIDALIADDSNASQFLIKKDVIDEISNIADKIIFKVGNQPDKDLTLVAKILATINGTAEGRKLICEMKMAHKALERLKTEMKKFENNSNEIQFAFDSDHSRKVKTENAQE